MVEGGRVRGEARTTGISKTRPYNETTPGLRAEPGWLKRSEPVRSRRQRCLSQVCLLVVGLLSLAACTPATLSDPTPTPPLLPATSAPATLPAPPSPSPSPAAIARRDGSYEGGTYRYAVPP